MKMVKFLTRNYSPLNIYLMSEMFQNIDKCRAVTGISDCVHDLEYARHISRLDETWIDTVSKKHINSEAKFFSDFIKRGQIVGNDLCILSRQLWETNVQDQTVISERNLEDFLTWADHYQSNAAFILVTHPLAKAVETKLLNILTKYGVPVENLDQALLDLSVTRKSNSIEEENFDLFIIQNAMKRADFDLEAALKEHMRKHAYVKYRDPFSGGYDMNYFSDRLNSKLELPNYFLPYADIISQFSDEEKEWVELQEEFVFYRTYRTERAYEALYYLERFLTGLEESLNLETHELSYYIKAEMVDFLKAGKRIDHSILSGRRQEFALTLHNGILATMEGNKAVQWVEENFEEKKSKLNEVKGLAAYRGKITGKVRVVMNVQDQDSLVEGEIMVVPMTTPDYLPGMQKAAAFVTDEGGVICHAAIVARELKKPCVIGTKIATTVFCDGDLVEVDGFTGFVRMVTPC
jgi:phosphohistidine swiveling domain-containing protein